MQPRTLSEKGIERLIKLEINLILQVIGPIKQTGGESNLMKVSLSDGFAFLKDVLLTLEARQGIPNYENSDFMNCVIKVQGLRNIGRQDKIIIVVSQFDLINGNIEDKIGSPVSYQDFKKKGNSNSTNVIPGAGNIKKGSFSKQQKQENRKSKDKKQKLKQNSETEKQVSKKHKPIQAIQPTIKKVSPQKREGPIHYTPIDDLMVDQTGWTILARLTNKSEPRSFVGKKGPSSIMSIELMDRSKKTIQGVFFGDIAIKLNQQLEINECYEVSGGNVQMARAQGNQARQLQLVFHQKSVFKLFKGKQAKQIPYIEDMAIKIKQIIDKDPDQQHGWNIIGVVREQRKLDMLKTKAGKDMAKKTIVVCDPDDKIEIPITLFFNLAEKELSDEVYIFKGVFVGEYQSKKQFSMSFRSNIIKFPSYRFNNRRDLEDIDFKMGVEESVPNKKSSSLMKVLQDQEKVTQGSSLWNRVRCYINAVKTSGTLWYMGCPQCKKKVLVDGPFSCTKCKKKFQMPKYYYILNIQVQDWYSSIWLTVYDESAKLILDGLEADQAKDMDLDEFRERTKKIKNMEIQLLIQSRGETYQGVFRVKHSGVKLLQIMYEQSAKEHLKKIKEYIYI